MQYLIKAFQPATTVICDFAPVMALYICDECKLDCSTMEELTRHYKLNHPEVAKRLTKDVSC